MSGSFLMHYGIPEMKWGVRRFQEKGSSKRTPEGKIRYTHSEKGLSEKLYKKAVASEPKITKTVTKTIKACGAKVYGLKNRLKTRESIQRKIAADSEHRDISLTKAAKDIKDTIRYTAVLDDKNFVSGYEQIKKDLESKGYTETRCRNYFYQYRKGQAKHK